MEIKTILVPTDFSQDANAALETAIEFAKRFGARIQLLHAYHLDVPPIYSGLGGDFSTPFDLLEPIRTGAETSMQSLVEETATKGVDVDGRVVMEHASGAIIEEAKQLPADMIVIGTRGLTGLDHLLLGSTAERVVRLAPCPVVTVKS